MSRYLALTAAAAGFALATWQNAKRSERELPPPGRFLTVDGIRLHYLDRGPTITQGGAPVDLLHGNGAMVEDFEISGLIDRLAERRRVVAIDRPGFGRSERPRGRAATPEAQAELLLKMFGMLGLDRPIVLGHSFGSLVAMALALDHPDALRGVVFEAGYFFPTARLDAALFSPQALPVIGDAIRYTIAPPMGQLLAGPLIRKVFAPLPVPPRFAAQFPVALTVRPWQIRASAEDTAAMVPAAARQAERHGELKLPIEILAGKADKIVDPQAQSARLHDALPHSRLTLIPGAGHMLHHATPETVALAVERLAGD